MVVQTYEYAKCPWIVYFNMVNFKLCEFLPNKNDINTLQFYLCLYTLPCLYFYPSSSFQEHGLKTLSI